jgi:hypothetical protein
VGALDLARLAAEADDPLIEPRDLALQVAVVRDRRTLGALATE